MTRNFIIAVVVGVVAVGVELRILLGNTSDSNSQKYIYSALTTTK